MGKEQQEERQRKVRRDAGIPRLSERDLCALRWIGEQGAANTDVLRNLLGRLSEYELDDPERLSATRVRHILEDRWLPAKMVEVDSILGQKWVWLTRRGLNRTGLPFSPHRPADVTINHLHQMNRIRLYLEDLYPEERGSWESPRWLERIRKDWKAQKKEDPYVHIPGVYKIKHMPDAVWTFRNQGEEKEYKVFIEVEVSSKGLERTVEILRELAIYGFAWYFVEMDPKKGVYKTLMQALDTLQGREERYKSHLYFYDLAQPDRLVHRFESQKQSG